ncbi:metallophosphoesterase [Candidatus Symbiopectobacterium sp. NZEC151]|nr:metallophosphoesterase [Candidatus Symbiopectobacterium sp. NZEC151]MCW2486016.1 metallophosphoesterase [Candidatus Symbiopectobacterium sp. NZEC127]
MAAVCEFHWFTRLLTGNMFSPELSRPLMILVGWLFGVAVFLAGLLLLRDALYLILRILFGQPLTHQSGLRGLLLAVAVILSSVAVWQGIRAPQVNHVRITLKGLPPQFEGFSIVQLADLHSSRLLPRNWVQDVVTRTNALNADLIVLTGDMVDGWVMSRYGDIEPLGDLRAKHGVWAVTGNHEYYFCAPDWVKTFEKLGLTFLNNSATRITQGSAAIYLAGVTDAVAPKYGLQGPQLNDALAARRPDDTVILLDHRPGNARQNEEMGVSLQLSGHTHGGMISGLDKLIGSANNGFVSGQYPLGAMTLYVSNGTGIWNGFPFRLGKQSEITLITLHSTNHVLRS